MVANKKQKTEEGARPSTTCNATTTTTTTKGPPPPYGSRQYWEDRYRKHVGDETTTTTTTTTDESSVVVVVKKDDPPPPYDDGAILFHEWYFTYEELRPLLLPIIFGGTRIDPKDVTKEENEEEEQATEQKVVSDVEEVSSDEKHKDAATATRNDDSKDGNEEDEEGEEEEDEWVEVEDGRLSEGDGEDSEELVEREGLGKYGPVSIIEIGCGDVPLGASLAEELNDLQRQTGSPAGCVVKRIVCLDFSETVISMLQNKQQEQRKEQLQEQPPLDRRNDVELEYVAADARTLDYADGSFQLVLEKGTLDAMLSDKETGAASSMLIVKQCARILSVGGYFVLISHLNAHAEHGRQWLNELVIPGLKGGDSHALWEIEVHGEEDNTGNGKDEEEEEDNDDDENEKKQNEKDGGIDKDEENETKEEGDSTDSPGPAVYIIRKLPPKPEGNEDATVPLRLFSY